MRQGLSGHFKSFISKTKSLSFGNNLEFCNQPTNMWCQDIVGAWGRKKECVLKKQENKLCLEKKAGRLEAETL